VEGDTTYYYDLRFGQKGMSNDPSSFVFCYKLFYKDGVIVAEPAERNMSGMKKGLEQLFTRLKGI
jgi:inner membrane protein